MALPFRNTTVKINDRWMYELIAGKQPPGKHKEIRPGAVQAKIVSEITLLHFQTLPEKRDIADDWMPALMGLVMCW